MTTQEKLERLVRPAWLHEVIHGIRLEGYPNRPPSTFEVCSEGQASYTSGHIPGAQYLDTTVIEAPPL